MQARHLLPVVALVLLAVPAGALPRSTAPFDQVCLATTAGVVDATQNARNPVPLDTPVGATRVGGTHFALFGLASPFRGIQAMVGQGGSDGTLVWFYSTSTGWSPLAATGSANLDASGPADVGFRAPHDWAQRPSDCGKSLYFVMAVTDTPYMVIPILDSAQAVA